MAGRLAVVVAIVLALAACGASTPEAHPAPSGSTPSRHASEKQPTAWSYAHVMVVVFENHARSQIVGSPDAHYLTGLAAHGAFFTHSFAIEHPSEPNYLDLFSGSNQGVTDDSCPHTFSTNNLGHQLIASGRTFVGYAESLPSAGSLVCSSGEYARKHAPWTNFSDLRQPLVDRPYSAFPASFGALPTLSWVTPNLCDDMHDCSVAAGDAWARQHLSAYATWARTHDSLLIVTFDEDDTAAGNNIATIFYGAHIRSGRYAERIDHFTVLRTLERLFRLPALGMASHRSAVTNVFTR